MKKYPRNTMAITIFEKNLDEFCINFTDNELLKYRSLKEKYSQHFEKISNFLYEKLTPQEQHWLMIWFVKRWGNVSKIPFNEYMHYKGERLRIETAEYPTISLKDKVYKKLNLEDQGYKGELITYQWTLGIHDFLFNQYTNENFKIDAGDVIIDAGAFVGDTAVIFAQSTNNDCLVHAFELLDENIELLKINVENHNICDKVILNKLALSNTSNATVKINAKKLQGATSIFGCEDGEEIKTITIDDYIKKENIEKLDLIKMDIEGAERYALEGSLESIKKFKPKLAICLYHLWDDIFEIPLLIEKSGVDYQYNFKWVEFLHGWEAVLLCVPKNK